MVCFGSTDAFTHLSTGMEMSWPRTFVMLNVQKNIWEETDMFELFDLGLKSLSSFQIEIWARSCGKPETWRREAYHSVRTRGKRHQKIDGGY